MPTSALHLSHPARADLGSHFVGAGSESHRVTADYMASDVPSRRAARLDPIAVLRAIRRRQQRAATYPFASGVRLFNMSSLDKERVNRPRADQIKTAWQRFGGNL